jgi:signal transduction histidine kinase
MTARSARLPFRPLLALLFAVSAAQFDSRASAATAEKQVLVLHSTRRTTQLVAVSDRELPRILGAALPEAVDYYTEFVDEARFPLREYQLAFRNFLRSKYKEITFDLVIAMGDNALAFVDQTRRELFPETPVVFFASGAAPERPTNATGVTARLNLGASVRMAADLQPGLRNVFVVSSTDTSNRGYEEEARAQFKPFEQRLAFTYLTSIAREELEERLAKLPPHSMVYFLTFDRHGPDENFKPIEYLDRIAEVANAPTYSWVDSAMGHGIVGGSLKSQQAQIDAVAALARRVLRGEPADTIPIVAPDLNVRQVDWRQLQRWGISESRVPAGTLIRFREPGVWERYKLYILGAAAIVAGQTSLILGLLVQASRRRKAEQNLIASEAQLRKSCAEISALGGRLLFAQEAERSRVARELHDDVSQQLTVLAVDLQQLAGRGAHPRTEKGVLDALAQVKTIARNVHDLSHRLHPARLKLLGLVSAVDSLQRELSQPCTEITFTHQNVPGALDDDQTLCLYRLAQEAVQNALRYSGAAAIAIHLSGADGNVTLSVVDNGKGFEVETAHGRGLGLISMQERVEAISGRLTIQSAHGAGTRIVATVPIHAGEASRSVAV